jgi:hypothetical protein
MSIKEFHLFHGALLTQLVRSERPLTLRMIETRAADSWSTYRINSEISLNPRKLARVKGGISWSFVFSKSQMSQVSRSDAWAALICGAAKLTAPMGICLLNPDEIRTLLDISSTDQQSLTVRSEPRKQFRVKSSRADELLVPVGRVQEWDIPGS